MIPAVLVDIAVCVVELCPAAHKTDTAVQREDPLCVLGVNEFPVAVRTDRVARLIIGNEGLVSDQVRLTEGAADTCADAAAAAAASAAAAAATTAAAASAAAASASAAAAVTATAAADSAARKSIVRNSAVVVITRVQRVFIALNCIEQIVECLLEFSRRCSRIGALKDCDCIVDTGVHARNTVDQGSGLLAL